MRRGLRRQLLNTGNALSIADTQLLRVPETEDKVVGDSLNQLVLSEFNGMSE